MAVAVVDEWHGHGLGTALGDLLVTQARASGLAALTGSTLAFNSPGARRSSSASASGPRASPPASPTTSSRFAPS